MLKVDAVEALRDNYIWVLRREGSHAAVAVDPGESKPLLAHLQRENLTLTDILITHHHPDHTGGIPALAEHFPVRVHAPAHEHTPISCVSNPVEHDDTVQLEALGLALRVMAIPGHTLGHVAYLGDNMLFCGDTLFSAGCGRIFEGDARQMHDSLSRLACVPADTRVYCGHEYTCRNLAFALTVEPENRHARQRLQQAESARKAGQPTLPSDMGTELQINPFLRCAQPSVRQAASRHAGREVKDSIDALGALRDWKNNF